MMWVELERRFVLENTRFAIVNKIGCVVRRFDKLVYPHRNATVWVAV